MRKHPFVFTGFVATLSLLSCAHHVRVPSSVASTLNLPMAAKIPTNSCRTDRSDAFEPDAHMPLPLGKRDHYEHVRNARGDSMRPRFVKGLDPVSLPCIVTNKARPVSILEPAQVERYVSAWKSDINESPSPRITETLVFSNFYFEGQFWIAEVDPSQIESIQFLLEHFPAIVPAAHSMLRFNMKRGHELRLYPQKQEQVTHGVQKVSSFISSVEATGAAGYKFDLVGGLFDEMAIVYRFVSLDDIAKGKMMINHHKVEQIQLKISPADRGKVLRFAVAESQKNGLSEFYNTLAKNCTTEPYRALDHAINYPLLNDIGAFLTQHRKPLPTLAERALKARGIFEGYGETLNEEFHFELPAK